MTEVPDFEGVFDDQKFKIAQRLCRELGIEQRHNKELTMLRLLEAVVDRLKALEGHGEFLDESKETPYKIKWLEKD